MSSTNTIVRKNLRDLNNPLVVRELNRQMDWIWKKLLGGIQEKDLDPSTTTKIIKRTEETITQKISAGSVETDELVASLAALMVAQIGIANIDFQKVVDMTTEQAIIKRMMANKVFIEKLVVTEANILSATLGTLVLKSSDGKYYTIAISSDGTIETEEVIPTEDDIANGVYDGREIVTDIDDEDTNIADLSASNLNAQNAMIGTILTTALTAGKITAAEAMLAAAVIPELYVTAVNAIGDSMTFSANKTIQFIVGEQEKSRKWFVFDEDAMTVRKEGSKWSTETREDGFYVKHSEVPGGVVGAFHGDVLEVQGLKVGNLTVYPSGTGGWVWVDK